MCAPPKALTTLALLLTIFITSCMAAVARGPMLQARNATGLVNGGRRPNAAVHVEPEADTTETPSPGPDTTSITAPDITTITTTTTTAAPTTTSSQACFPVSKCVDYLVCGVRFGSCYPNHCDGKVPTFSTPACAKSTMMKVAWVSTTTTTTSSSSIEPISTDSPAETSTDYQDAVPTVTQTAAAADPLAAASTDPQNPAATDLPVI